MEGKEQKSFLEKIFPSRTDKFSTPLATKDHPSDKAIIFLQDLFESHRKDLKALQNSTEAQELIIKLLKIPNEEKTQDTYEHGVNSLCDEVQFKSLCDLMSIQTWQVRCAVNGFEKLTNWLCNVIEISKTNLSSAWMTLNEQLKRTNHHTLTDSKSTTTSTKAVKENIDAIQRVIAGMNEKYKHARLEQKQSKTDDDRQDYDNNDNYQVLKDDVDKLKETNSQLKSYLSRYEKDVKKRLDIKDNLKQQIDEWKKTKEKVQSATLVESLNQQLDVSQLSDQRPPPSTDDNYENETQVSNTAKAEKNKTSFEVHQDDLTVMSTTINAPKTKDGLLEVQNVESLNQQLDVSQHSGQSPPPSTDDNYENKIQESDTAKAEKNKISFKVHHDDLTVMSTTINAPKTMDGSLEAQNVRVQIYNCGANIKHFVEDLLEQVNKELDVIYITHASDIKQDLPLLVICSYVSRLATDAKNATKDIEDPRSTVLLVFHYGDSHTLSSISDQLLVGGKFSSLYGIYDIAYTTDKGVYPHDMNTQSISKLKRYMDVYRRKQVQCTFYRN